MSSTRSQNGTGKPPRSQASADRDARLKQALKANLARRKAQARARDKAATKPDDPGRNED